MKCISKGVHKITFNGRLIRFLWGIGESLGLNWLRLWLGAWQHQAITWANVDDVVDKNHDLKSDTYILHYHILIKCVDTGVAGIILGIDSANERRRYIVTPPLIGWTHIQNDPCVDLTPDWGLKHFPRNLFWYWTKSIDENFVSGNPNGQWTHYTHTDTDTDTHTHTHTHTSPGAPRVLMSCENGTPIQNILKVYTLGKKGCYTPIEDNKTNVDRTFVFPLGWNWHDPWLFPNEIRHYLGQTFNARSSGIVELRNHSIGGRSPKSIFTLWRLWINICIFFQKFFWLFEQCPVQPLWVLGMRCLHLPVRALSKVLLLPVWVWLVLPSTAYSKGMLPLDLWCQASLQGLPERQHIGKTVHCWGWSDRIVSWVLGPWRRGWEIWTEWGLVAQRLTTDSCPVVTGHIDPQRSPCWLPTTVVSAWSGRRGGGTWQWPTGSMSSSVMSRDSNFTW